MGGASGDAARAWADVVARHNRPAKERRRGGQREREAACLPPHDHPHPGLGTDQREQPEGQTERNQLVLIEARSSGRRWLRRFARSAVCVLAVAVPCACGDSVTNPTQLSTTRLATQTMPNLVSADGKSKGLLTSLEALFKKNCELLGKLRVELNDFSDGLDSLRELADSKLKGAFTTDLETPPNEIASSCESLVTPSEHPSEPTLAVTQEAQEADAVLDDPRYDRKGLRASNPMQRGDQHTPPQMKHLRRHGSMDEIVLTEEDELGARPVDEVVCFLDLDKCTIYGQDGNDLAIAMQWMGRPQPSVVELYRRLMNPQIKPLMNQLKRSTKKTPVVLYTMRPQLLQYRSAARNTRVNLRWKKEWHHSPDQVVIPPEVKCPEDVLDNYDGLTPLLQGEKQDLLMSFQRLLAIRQVVEEELGLDYTPNVVVTSTMKDVQSTAEKLGMRPERAFLWDDNQVLQGQPHVLTVDPYVAMDRKCRDRLLLFLQQELPAEQLREEVVHFMLGAKPDQRCVRVKSEGEGVEYFVNEAVSIPRFPIPELPVCYSRPRFTGTEGASENQQKASLREHFNSNIVEFWSAAWRKMDSEQLAARQKWKENLEMVW